MVRRNCQERRVLQVGIKEVESVSAGDLPDSLHADVSDLDIGDTITLSDIEIPDRVELLSEFDSMVATVLLPTMEEEKSKKLTKTKWTKMLKESKKKGKSKKSKR